VEDKQLYIIAGCNGAGKTTASFTILPELLNCREFINADEIARGLSPFQPEKVAVEAGRIMLHRMDDLMNNGVTFAFETTLATKSYASKIRTAQRKGYFVTLIFFWLDKINLAMERVSQRVINGGHNIPAEIIERRYIRGIQNLFNLYLPVCDKTLILDNSGESPIFVMSNIKLEKEEIFDTQKLAQLKNYL
jgi:predicted ABC-type ATPase